MEFHCTSIPENQCATENYSLLSDQKGTLIKPMPKLAAAFLAFRD